jgi:hypothetical protein
LLLGTKGVKVGTQEKVHIVSNTFSEFKVDVSDVVRPVVIVDFIA